MSSFPVMSGCKAVGVFEALGWQVARQRGSHIIMVKVVMTRLYQFPIIKKWRRER